MRLFNDKIATMFIWFETHHQLIYDFSKLKLLNKPM